MNAALSDLRVLDVATFIAAPFCGSLLAELGAEVVKIEQPDSGDSLRRFGTMTECGDSLTWLSEGRNKRSVTLDLRSKQGAEIFLSLAEKSDVVLENFRPGTLEKWGIGHDMLKSVNPRIVLLRVSAYGQTGPLRDKPGFARIAHAFSGLAYLSGMPGGPPVVPGSTSLADYLSGLFGAVCVLAAVRHAEKTGQGQVIDIGLYESVFRVLDEIAPAFQRSGFVRERMGPDTVNIVPHSHYEAADGRWVAIACSNDRMWQRLCTAMGREDLSTDPDYATLVDRNARRAAVNAIVAAWVAQRPAAEVVAACDKADAPSGVLMNIAEIFEHPQYAARENLVEVDDPRVGKITIPATPGKMSKTPLSFKHLGEALGASTDQLLAGLLGLSALDIDQLRQSGVI